MTPARRRPCPALNGGPRWNLRGPQTPPGQVSGQNVERAALARITTALVVAAVTALPLGAGGQELEPRSYVNTPVGLNFVLAGYGYTDGDVVFSPSSPIKDGEVQTHTGFLAYVRAVDVFGLSGKAGILVPYAAASGRAKVAGERRERDVSGFADPKLRVSVNFYGAPALTLEDLGGYQQDLIVGATVEVSAPLGQYNPDRLLNIGTNRWSIRTELGASKALGPFILEVSAGATFFTRNDDFLGGKTLEQDPLYAAQGHLVYEFRSGLWAAMDGTYYTGGRTSIDGEEGERLRNARLGLTLAVPVNRYNSIKLYGSTGVYSRTGTDFRALGIAWQVRWGGGL